MTHDELLKYVQYEYSSTYEDWCGNVPDSPKALLAVVKLHTPRKAYFGDDEIVCRACGSADIEWTYPCPTIQAIEKELA